MKTFDQYINEYHSTYSVNFWDSSWSDSYNNMPFEIKIGLFKFICDDLNLYWFKALNCLRLNIPRKTKLHDICPIEFINQIIEL